MDKYVNLFQELNNVQSKICLVFQDLINEKNQYHAHLEESNKHVTRLYDEVKDLRKQNKILKDSTKELKSIIADLFCIFYQIGHSKIDEKEEQKRLIEKLKIDFYKISNQIENFSKSDLKAEEDLDSFIDKTRCILDEDVIKKEIESISKLQFSTQFYNDEEDHKNLGNNDMNLNNEKSSTILEKLFERKPPDNQTGKLAETIVQETEVPHSSSSLDLNGTLRPLIQTKDFVTPKKKNVIDGSPVFKDLGNRKPEYLPAEESERALKYSPIKLFNEKFLLKNSNVAVSPMKRSSNLIDSPPKKGNSTPKRPKRAIFDSPKRSPNPQLKKSNSREAEISVLGIRKLTQTVLNIDCFKKKSPEKKKNRSNVENEDFQKFSKEVSKNLLDVEEDDVILESPKSEIEIVENLIENTAKKENYVNEIQFLTPPATSGAADLDETYVSSSIVKNCKLAGKNGLEKIIEDQTPLKRPAHEKSPEYDSVPFMYKREALRKRSDRLKLPGHTCPECNKYYKDVFGNEANSRDLREILNKCSRHRDQVSPSAEETPPGYWKPYLTASNIISPSKDGTLLR